MILKQCMIKQPVKFISLLEAGWGDLSQGELEGENWRDKEREKNKKTLSNEIFNPS